MTTKLVTAFAIAAGLVLPTMAQTTATTNMEILREKLKADKKVVVAQNLQLTDAENAAFWPVFEAYQKDLQQINQRLAAVVKAYADAYNTGAVANDVAKKLLDEAVAIDEAEAKLKSAFVPKILGYSRRRKRHATSRSKTRFGRSCATSWPRAYRLSRRASCAPAERS